MTQYCSFCGKSEHDEPIKLITGPKVNICNACVSTCVDLLLKNKALAMPVSGEERRTRLEDAIKPMDLRAEYQKISEGLPHAKPQETPMTESQIHDVAMLAARAAQDLNGQVLHGVTQSIPSPEQGAANVTTAYLNAVAALSAGISAAATATPVV